jgi:hypothetical protein
MGQTANACETLVENKTTNKKGQHVKPNNEARSPNIAAVESSKSKAIPLQALPGPEVSRSLRLADFKTIGTLRWQGCQPCAPTAFTPGNIPGTHFC